MTNTVSAALPVTERAPAASLTLDLTGLTESNTQLDALLPTLARLDDAQLLQLASAAGRLEACAFRLRGACVSELRRRITSRLPGGRGKRDAEGSGIQSQLTRLAAQIGISPSTLKTDARIHEVFFTDRAETRLARDTGLAREYYVTALGAPDPLAAIKIAEEKCAASDYKREEFRRDVRQLKGMTQRSGTLETIEGAPDPVRTDLSRLKLTDEAQGALHQLIEATGSTADVLISAALVARCQALTEARSNETTNASANDTGAKKPTKNKAAGKQMYVQPSLL